MDSQPASAGLKQYWPSLAAAIVGVGIFLLMTRPITVDYLTWIKGIALTVSLIFYLLYHWQRPHDPQTNKLTSRGRWVYGVLILSAMTALASFLVEERKKAEASAASKASTEQQLTTIAKVLAAVQYQQSQGQTQLTMMQSVLSSHQTQQLQTASILTNLDSQAALAGQTIFQIQRLVSSLPAPQLELEWEIDPSRPVSEELLGSLQAMTRIHHSRLAAYQTEIRAAHPSDPNPQPEVSLITGIFRACRSKESRFAFGISQLQTQLDFEARNNPGCVQLLNVLSQPAVTLRLYCASNAYPSYMSPDLYAVFTNLQVPAQATFLPEQNVLQCRWAFSASPATFHTTPKLFSLPDVAGSTFRLDITNSPQTYSIFFHPRRLTLKFDTGTLTVTNFADLPAAYSRRVRMSRDELARRFPGIQESLLAENDDPDFNPQGIAACRGTFPAPDQIRAESDPILLRPTAPPLSPVNLRIGFGQ